MLVRCLRMSSALLHKSSHMAGLGPVLDVARRTRVLAGHLPSPAVAATGSALALTPASSRRPLSSTSRPSAASMSHAETDGFEAGIIRGASINLTDRQERLHITNPSPDLTHYPAAPDPELQRCAPASAACTLAGEWVRCKAHRTTCTTHHVLKHQYTATRSGPGFSWPARHISLALTSLVV